MLGKANPDLVFTTRYVIQGDGKIHVRSTLSATTAQSIRLWRNCIITLGDPTFHTKTAEKLTAELRGHDQLSVRNAEWQPGEWVGYMAEQDGYRYYERAAGQSSK